MNYELIKAAVAAVIKENGNEEITGNLLQQVLHSIINILGVGYQYMGMATPSTVPGTPDARQFYFATEEGAYSNFSTSPITELDGRELAIFYYDTAWHVVMTGVATRDAMVGYAFYGESLASGSVITGIDENTFFLVGPGTYTINGYSTTISTPGISALMYDVSSDELINYTLLPYDTTPTEDSKNAITSGAVKTALDSKIDKVPDALTGEIPVFDGDGGLEGSNKLLSDLATQEDLEAVEQEVAQIAGEAGLAEAVIDTDGAGTEQEFTFRKSGGDGGAYYRKIKGKTIVEDNQLASNDAEAVETTGANQWDEEYVFTGIKPADGTPDGWNDRICSKNFIPVFPSTSYYFKMPMATYVFCYDADKNFIDKISFSGNPYLVAPGAIGVTPANTAYIKFSATGNSYGTTYNHDICINISNAAINGQYFPYWKRTLQLNITTKKDTDGNVPFADGMKGAGTARDWCDKVGGEIVMGEVNLGDLEWVWNNIYSVWQTGSLAGSAKAFSSGVIGNIISDKYTADTLDHVNSHTSDKTISAASSIGNIRVYDSSFSSSTNINTALAGVKYCYELATPVPFTWAEPLNLGVKVDENGTEKAVAPEGATAPSAPFVADTTYTMSVARMVAKLNTI